MPDQGSIEKSAEITGPLEAPKPVEKPVAPKPVEMAQKAATDYEEAETGIEAVAKRVEMPFDIPEFDKVVAEEEAVSFEREKVEDTKKLVENVRKIVGDFETEFELNDVNGWRVLAFNPKEVSITEIDEMSPNKIMGMTEIRAEDIGEMKSPVLEFELIPGKSKTEIEEGRPVEVKLAIKENAGDLTKTLEVQFMPIGSMETAETVVISTMEDEGKIELDLSGEEIKSPEIPDEMYRDIIQVGLKLTEKLGKGEFHVRLYGNSNLQESPITPIVLHAKE